MSEGGREGGEGGKNESFPSTTSMQSKMPHPSLFNLGLHFFIKTVHDRANDNVLHHSLVQPIFKSDTPKFACVLEGLVLQESGR